MKDISNKKFGRWTALFKVHNKSQRPIWLCKCECGHEREVDLYSLTNERSKSCGCLQKEITSKKLKHRFVKSLIGRKFGKLSVVEEFPERLRGGVQWKCKCECGNNGIFPSGDLLRGRIESCGCLKKIRSLFSWEKTLLYHYKYDAKRRNLNFNLSHDQFVKLIGSNCHYCGNSPSNLQNLRTIRKHYNGIDRIDSNNGYNNENCVPCCIICNRAKGKLTTEEFSEWAKKLSKNFK